jgi:hypothetical protein
MVNYNFTFLLPPSSLKIIAMRRLTRSGSTDGFVNDKPERRERQVVPAQEPGEEAGEEGMEEEEEIDGDGDNSHRQLDRKTNAARNKAAAEEAADIEARYAKNKYDNNESEDSAPKALLMPGVSDPSIWGVRCKVSL